MHTIGIKFGKTRLRSKVFSLESLWIKLLALKGFGLEGLEYKAKKVFRLRIRFLAPPSLGDRVKFFFFEGGEDHFLNLT